MGLNVQKALNDLAQCVTITHNKERKELWSIPVYEGQMERQLIACMTDSCSWVHPTYRK